MEHTDYSGTGLSDPLNLALEAWLVASRAICCRRTFRKKEESILTRARFIVIKLNRLGVEFSGIAKGQKASSSACIFMKQSNQIESEPQRQTFV